MKGTILALGFVGVFMVGCGSTLPSEPAMAPTSTAGVTQITNADLAPVSEAHPQKRPKLDWTDPYDGTPIPHPVRELDTSDPWDNGSAPLTNAPVQQAAASKL